MTISLEYQDETLLDYVVELVGRFKKRSAIAEILREDFPDIDIVTVSVLISRAKVKIREELNIDPKEFKGNIISCLEQIISGKAKHKDRLKALDMLADFTGVKQAGQEDPAEYVKRLHDAMKMMDESLGGTPDERSPQVEGDRQKESQEAEETTKEASKESQEPS